MVKAVARPRETTWAAGNRNSTVLAKRRTAEFWKVVQVEVHVICHVEVEIAVAVIISKRSARAPASRVADPSLHRDVAKRSVTIIFIKEGTSKTGDIEVVPAVVVVIPYRRSKAPAALCQAGLLRHVGERPVMVVVIQLARRASARFQIFEGRTVDQENVRPAVVVIVDKSNAPAQRFHDVQLLRAAARQMKVDPRGARHVHERRHRSRLPLRGRGSKQHRRNKQRAHGKRAQPRRGWEVHFSGAGMPSHPILPVVSSVPQTAVAPLRIPPAFAPSHKLAPAEKTDSGRPSSARPPSVTPRWIQAAGRVPEELSPRRTGHQHSPGPTARIGEAGPRLPEFGRSPTGRVPFGNKLRHCPCAASVLSGIPQLLPDCVQGSRTHTRDGSAPGESSDRWREPC